MSGTCAARRPSARLARAARLYLVGTLVGAGAGTPLGALDPPEGSPLALALLLAHARLAGEFLRARTALPTAEALALGAYAQAVDEALEAGREPPADVLR